MDWLAKLKDRVGIAFFKRDTPMRLLASDRIGVLDTSSQYTYWPAPVESRMVFIDVVGWMKLATDAFALHTLQSRAQPRTTSETIDPIYHDGVSRYIPGCDRILQMDDREQLHFEWACQRGRAYARMLRRKRLLRRIGVV